MSDAIQFIRSGNGLLLNDGQLRWMDVVGLQ